MEGIMRVRTSLALGLLLVLTAAGCAKGTGGDDGVASASGATPAASASASSGSRNPKDDQEQFLKFAQCMRDHGVPMEDPQFDGGGISLMIPEGTDKSKVDAAQAECKQYMPNGGEPPKLDAAQQEQMRKFAQCMRDNGISNFPDPSEEGGFQIDGDKLGIDPKSEQFKAAEQACKQFQPKGEGGEGGEHTSTNEGGGA
jgi:hypothetical protein